MKQRLALAATMLNDPELIILDEPANGLDPQGIREIREIIRTLTDRGKTIFPVKPPARRGRAHLLPCRHHPQEADRHLGCGG